LLFHAVPKAAGEHANTGPLATLSWHFACERNRFACQVYLYKEAPGASATNQREAHVRYNPTPGQIFAREQKNNPPGCTFDEQSIGISVGSGVKRSSISSNVFAKMERLALVDKSAKDAKKIIAQKARSHHLVARNPPRLSPREDPCCPAPFV